MKQIFNSTEGGARIKGTIAIPLCDFIKEHCKEPIDKSKIKPLLTLAEDGDELIEKVIPLLQDDIDNLDSIIKSSRIAMAASHGLKVLMSRKRYQGLMTKKMKKVFAGITQEAAKSAGGNFAYTNHIFYQLLLEKIKKPKLKHLIKLSEINYNFSVVAQSNSVKNPLVNVAVYGASRQIQGRQLKVDGELSEFLKRKDIAETRIARNSLILNAAKKAADSLKKSYKETLELLKEYNETKDDSVLRPIKEEEIDLNDAEDYFAVGNWAHPIVDTETLMKRENAYEKIDSYKTYEVWHKATSMKLDTIKQAKENEAKTLDHERKLLKYNRLIEDARNAGKDDKDFNKALELLKEAIEALPDEIEGREGYATALHHSGDITGSLIEYEKLIKDFPDEVEFKFQYGQVLIVDNQVQKGLQMIGQAMKDTDKYDSFLIRVGEIYEKSDMFDEAIIAYENYLDKFPHDFNAWYQKGRCLTNMSKKEEAKSSFKKALEINPVFKPAKDSLRSLCS